MRVVLDTNVLIAAFAAQGLCHALFELCIDGHRIILSPDIMEEMETVLTKKLKMPHSSAQRIISYLRDHTELHRIRRPFPRVSRDASDDHVLALAEQSKADYIITGDDDLLVLQQHGDIPIVQPRDFWQIMRDKGAEET